MTREHRRLALVLVASAYLAGVWLDGVGSTLPSHVLPRVANYFLQIAALFPNAATMAIDYRAEAWVCADRKWEEFDVRPFFPIDPDDKENRFQRVMHFFRQDETTMHALDTYLVERHGEGQGKDGIDALEPIGGVRMLSLRIPLPRPGEPLERNRRLPLAEYPIEERHFFYHTPRSKADERCGTTATNGARGSGAAGDTSGTGASDPGLSLTATPLFPDGTSRDE